ncbi:MAG: hypothetical protein HQL38_18130 [Alphaproteobacteria bacterium]|nr:hypothetical protein [Alphaproteobacteria bacterium]
MIPEHEMADAEAAPGGDRLLRRLDDLFLPVERSDHSRDAATRREFLDHGMKPGLGRAVEDLGRRVE